MKSEFTLTESFENFYGGIKVWIAPYKEEETPDMPILDLNMDISLSCRISCCLVADEANPENWKSYPVMIYGTIVGRRVVVDSRGQSHMIYTVAPTPGGADNICKAVHKALD